MLHTLQAEQAVMNIHQQVESWSIESWSIECFRIHNFAGAAAAT